jgi:hypothetical protein
MPIGRPVGERTAYILYAELNPLPQGVVGELFLGGAGLARGYLNQAALTAERFVADPFATEGGRLYRTGDLARWRADGQVEYLGRIDHQVKIRGFRIELGEVEAQLLAQPGVQEAVVMAQPGLGSMRLVGYVAPRADTALDVGLLKAALARVLPDYMVPSALVVLDALPLNPNGKVDRHALPQAKWGTLTYEAPLGAAEQILADLWAEVLGLERVGRHDNFFELGGHSLAAIRIVALLAQRHACDVPVRHFFDHCTLSALAAVLPHEHFAGAGMKERRLAEMGRLMSECEV